ncbi:MAG: hypothetical protein KF752_18775 [Pirellulaceae bacterium]|nr:hypothetical protein [Pirellulaceae bacterium]
MNSKRNLTQLSTRWLATLVVSLVAYGWLQPLANRRFGCNLPSLNSLLSLQQQGTSNETFEETVGKPSGSPGGLETDAQVSVPTTSDPRLPPALQLNDHGKALGTQKSEPSAGSAHLLHGLLQEKSRDEYVSPAGLRYTRGSEEGHRLKHLEKHLADQPDRPGRHGVFYGDLPQVLRWLDEAYTRACMGAKGTRSHEEAGRTVYEVTFAKPLGYIGGRDGKRQNNPDSRRLRLVVDGDFVITAFPF